MPRRRRTSQRSNRDQHPARAWAAIGLLAGWLAACAVTAQEQLPPARTIESAGDLLEALQQAGAEPVRAQGELLPQLGGSGSVLRLDGEQIEVYEYATQPQREARSENISPDGSQLDGQPLVWQGNPKLWGSGRLLVVYQGNDGGTILLLSGLLGDPLTFAGAEVGEPYPPAVPAAMLALATELGRPPEELEVVRYDQVAWPDACLGLPAEGESCAAAQTPGWRVILRLEGMDYEMHTDELGAQVRRR